MTRTPAILFAAILTLAATAAAVLALGARPRPDRERRAQEFQRLVGGLGFGPAQDLARCDCGFDPRLGSACANDVGPVPGGASFCPFHANAVFDFSPLDLDAPRP